MIDGLCINDGESEFTAQETVGGRLLRFTRALI